MSVPVIFLNQKGNLCKARGHADGTLTRTRSVGEIERRGIPGIAKLGNDGRIRLFDGRLFEYRAGKFRTKTSTAA